MKCVFLSSFLYLSRSSFSSFGKENRNNAVYTKELWFFICHSFHAFSPDIYEATDCLRTFTRSFKFHLLLLDLSLFQKPSFLLNYLHWPLLELHSLAGSAAVTFLRMRFLIMAVTLMRSPFQGFKPSQTYNR